MITSMLCYHCISNGLTPVVIDFEGRFRVETLECVSRRFNVDLLSKTIIIRVSEIKSPEKLKEYPKIILHPKSYSQLLIFEKPRVAIVHRSELKRKEGEKVPKGIRRVYCRMISERIFMLKMGEEIVKVEAFHDGVFDWKPKLKGLHAKAYEAIHEALTEYGPLTLVDVVTVVSGTLKIKKDLARKIVSDLIKGGYLMVVGKLVLIQ